MKEQIKKLIDDISEGNLSEAKDVFNAILAKKIDERLGDIRKVVNNNIIQTK